MNMNFTYHTQANQLNHEFTQDNLNRLLKEFKKIIDNPETGFFHLTDKTEIIDQTLQTVKKFNHKKHFVQIGIGGSALGPQMLVNALRKDFNKTFHLFDNIDPDYIQQQLAQISAQDTVFYIVSKSGGTAETLASYAIAINFLKAENIPKTEWNQHLIFCTENKDSELMQHIKDENYPFLEIPINIGGRFSVLSPVGLLPAAFFGVDIQKLYDGANCIKQELLSEDFTSNPLLQTTAHVLNLYNQTSSVDQTVLMPYSSLLKDLSSWFVQLWAESLGKWSDTKNKSVGITPVPAYGATDQHSQVQLFMEGPNNKLLILLNVENTYHDFKLENDLPIKRAEILSEYSLNQLMQAEYNGTLKALKENQRNIITITIPKVSTQTVSSLILFLESLTALVGKELSIDPFNQPGVEKGKIYTFEYLKNLKIADN